MTIVELHTSGLVDELISNLKVPQQYQDDLKQEIYLILLEKDYLSKLQDNEVKYFLVAIIKHQFYSKTSPFYFKFKKFQQITNDINDSSL